MTERADSFDIRVASLGDAIELARLLTTLGFPTTSEDVAARWSAWAQAGNVAVVAIDRGGRLIGAATLHLMHVLHRANPVGRITALIVDEAQRDAGIGRALVEAAEQQLLAAGCGLVEVTSNDRLVDAHAFYQHLGYDRTSIRLAKRLPISGQTG